MSLRPGLPPAGAALVQANQVTLAEARVAPPSRAGMRSQAAVVEASAGQVCLQDFAVSPPKGQFTPGGLIYMRGCGLGSARGQLRMLGSFPGGRVDLEVQAWTNELVVAQLPAGLGGVDDQDVRVSLATRDGRHSREHPARFLARRESRELPMTQVANVACARPQPSECRVIRSDGAEWAWAQHTGDDSQGGRDEWRLSFGTSFDLDRIETKPGSSGQVQVAAGARSGGQQTVTADWRSQFVMEPSTHSARYAVRFFVTGPVGLPVVADRP